MAKVVITAYTVEASEGAREGMGLDLVAQIANYHEVYLVTQKKYEATIQQLFHTEQMASAKDLHILYYDLPKLMQFLCFGKKSSTYFYLWQIVMPLWIRSKKIELDLVHNLNLHNDWTPTFLWLLGKPLVWGPIGHQPKLPFNQLFKVGVGKWLGKRYQYLSKALSRKLDPFLKMALHRTDVILATQESLKGAHQRIKNKIAVLPEAIQNPVLSNITVLEQNTRFVLKMYTIALNKRSWLQHLPEKQKMMHEPIIVTNDYEEALADVA